MSRYVQIIRPLVRIAVMASLVISVSTLASAQSTNPVKLIKGTVLDSRSGKPIDGGKVFVHVGANLEPVAQSRINPKTGAFQVVLGPSADYRFIIRSPRFLQG